MSVDEGPSAGGEGWMVCAKRVQHQDGAPYFFPAKVINHKADDSAIVVRFLDNGQCLSVPVGDIVGEGPSFRPVSEVVLPKGQLVYFEHPPGHSRSGRVVEHLLKFQKVQIESDGVTLSKPLRQISLLPPAESETKFSRLQEALNGPPLSEAKRADQTEFMDELAAAMVLTSLSCSPASGASSGFGSDLGSPSTLHDDDEDMEIVVDETSQWLFYKCLWPGCGCVMSARNTIGAHVRNVHLGSESDEKDDDYFTAFEVNLAEIDGFAHSLPEPSRNFDHDYHNKHAAAKLSASFPRARASPSLPIDIPGRARSNSFGRQNFSSPRTRRTRSEVKKCRKVYGMENRDLWCTHCKWKKACTRFVD